MAVLQQPSTIDPTPPAWETALVFAFFVFLSLVGGSVLAWVLVDAGWVDGLVEKFGAPRVMRRVQTLVAIVLAPWLLKRVGWRGLRDIGWRCDQGCPRPGKDFVRGFGLGILLLGGLMLVSISLGLREWDLGKNAPADAIRKVLTGFLVTGMIVGVLEETFSRGVLFRSLARCWGVFASAAVTAGVFAYVHFLKARPEAFDNGVIAVITSSLFDGLADGNRVGLQLLNLSLLSVALCIIVHKRGHIWMAVGFHAAVVGMIRSNTVLAEQVGAAGFWFGYQGNFTDGAMCTLWLLALIGWVSVSWKRYGRD